ncbi:hypothetical protein [Aromatoleum petrolei]|uniref:Uncharacterized protein n=1 Tax=Aromatoleum petrolei TaxID=76116 RepID=A0ABX1MW33_9RHOO|nr:hypothetical protein [Aromatoleum petrolei]NMF90555.1 hypothetical protein [Aromatoleum petrolei]QTQ36775.1 Uncharacterized protein ToN1_26370 [Aromatoleum petrolei]
MLLADKRIDLDARPAPRRLAPVEVVMIGHCPSFDGSAEWKRLARDLAVLAEIAALGFTAEVDRLRALDAGEAEAEPGDGALFALYRLPIPIRSLGYFQALFPQAFDTDGAYRSALAGRAAWLPAAVQDFFAGEDRGFGDTRTLWIIRVPESGGVRAFLPQPNASLIEPSALGAFERALLIERAGILALPDLERLLVPRALPDIPRVRLDNPEAVFLPCGTEIDDTHRERRRSDEMLGADAPLEPIDIVPPIIRTLARLRPDMQCLLTLPLDQRPRDELPAPARDFLAHLALIAGEIGSEAGGGAAVSPHAELAGKLRHLQLLWPYLRSEESPLASPCGLVAGMQARVSQRHGVWRSIAGRPLPTAALPWPPVTQQQATALREVPGVTVLLTRAGKLQVDDEALCAPCLPAADLRSMTAAQRAQEHWRSAEVMRFMGWLRRGLQALGEQLLFDADPRDPRPELALRAFFERLHEAGALRGARPESAYRIREIPSAESTIAFEIEIAPAYPIDRLRLTFLHDRHAAVTDTRIEAVDG